MQQRLKLQGNTVSNSVLAVLLWGTRLASACALCTSFQWGVTNRNHKTVPPPPPAEFPRTKI
eukprot:5877522-Amphidinium_carterae.1